MRDRFPIEPLMDAVGAVVTEYRTPRSVRYDRISTAECGPATRFSMVFDMDPRTYYRYRAKGIPWERADELAVALGLHPSAIWGDAWFAGALEEGAGAAA